MSPPKGGDAVHRSTGCLSHGECRRREVVPRPCCRIGEVDAVLREDARVHEDARRPHAGRDAVQLAVDPALIEERLRELRGVEDVGVLVDVGECSALRVGGEMRLVELHHVRCVAAGGGRGELVPVPTPLGGLRLHRDVRVLLLEEVDRSARALIARTRSPPRERDGDVLVAEGRVAVPAADGTAGEGERGDGSGGREAEDAGPGAGVASHGSPSHGVERDEDGPSTSSGTGLWLRDRVVARGPSGP